MKSLVVVTPDQLHRKGIEILGHVDAGGKRLYLGQLDFAQPEFDRKSPANREHVLLRVRAFACNFRDKGILMDNYLQMDRLGKSYLPFGSDFCAEVVAVGSHVTAFRVGDRVMGDFAYPKAPAPGLMPGVATNFASLGWLKIHAAKLTAVPPEMSDQQAAAFALGAQTAAGMIRRSGILESGGNPVILSARSATSLFIAQQLIGHGFRPHCLSSSEWSSEQLQALPGATTGVLRPGIFPAQTDHSKFTHVFDPFFDINLEAATLLLANGGTYVTCGLRDQHPLLSDSTPEESGVSLRRALTMAVLKNLSVKGNCLGESSDLAEAVRAFRETRIGPVIDSVFKPREAIAFLVGSFFDPGRFGKCVMTLASVDPEAVTTPRTKALATATA